MKCLNDSEVLILRDLVTVRQPTLWDQASCSKRCIHSLNTEDGKAVVTNFNPKSASNKHISSYLVSHFQLNNFLIIYTTKTKTTIFLYVLHQMFKVPVMTSSYSHLWLRRLPLYMVMTSVETKRVMLWLSRLCLLFLLKTRQTAGAPPDSEQSWAEPLWTVPLIHLFQGEP